MIDPEGHWRSLAHGPTEHGRQATAGDLRRLPTTYFHPSGPLADIIRGVAATGDFDRVAVVGLGAGTIAAYGQPGQHMDFYEIDPAVVRIASNPAFFSYLEDSAADVRVIVGDGRLEIAQVPDGFYDLIVLDAFSSDAPPVHLLTTEALQLYFQKLRPGGVVAVNVSSRTLRLVPVLTSAAAALELVSGVRLDGDLTPDQIAAGKRPSIWVVLARQGDPPDAILPLADIPGWLEVEPPPGFRVWTDDYSNIVSVLGRR
jgi:SAM-dependent methyltransferase